MQFRLFSAPSGGFTKNSNVNGRAVDRGHLLTLIWLRFLRAARFHGWLEEQPMEKGVKSQLILDLCDHFICQMKATSTEVNFVHKSKFIIFWPRENTKVTNY